MRRRLARCVARRRPPAAGLTRVRLDQDTKLIYRHFATLYFIVLCDKSESELGILDLIQGACTTHAALLSPAWLKTWLCAVYVETLDRSFESVCELDLIFNSPKARTRARRAAWQLFG